MPPSDPKAPARPQRRFSALKRPVKRTGPASADAEAPDAAEAAVPAVAAEPADAPAAEPAAPSSDAAAPNASEGTRIAKVMARAGLCSRRDAEGWIADGRVAVNGATIASPALNIGPGDAVTVDGYPIDKPERTRLFLFHKTRGLVTTARDPEGRPTVFDVLPEALPRLMTVGRLDINTEGLLLLTNDGGLARLLELPATGWIRRYRVRANGSVDQATLDGLAKGVTVDGVAYAGIAAKLDRVQGANLWLTMGLKEGKNREIKRVLEHLGLAVTRLIRISFGPFQLGELAENGVEEVRTRVLRDQLGSALAQQAGLDFEGPVNDGAEAAREPAARAAGGRGRAGTAEGAGGEPRRLTRRTATADRRGRSVTVERITTLAPGRGKGGRSRADGREADPADQQRRWQTRPAPDGRAEAERPSRRDEAAPSRRFEEAGRDGEARFGGGRPARSGAPGRSRGGQAGRDERGPARDPAAGGDRPRDAGDRRPARADGGPGTRPFGNRNARAADRPGDDRAWSKRSAAKGDRTKGDGFKGDRFKDGWSKGDRPKGERPKGDRPQGGRARGEGPQGGRPWGERPQGGRPGGSRPGNNRPGGGRPKAR